MQLSEFADFLILVISREDVQAGNISPCLSVLGRLIESPETARQFAERVEIAFHGYDDLALRLFETPEVRSFVAKLDEQFPYWLFFLSKYHIGLQCVLLCFFPPFLTETACAEIFPVPIGELLKRRWFPAMNHMCAFAGLSEQEMSALTGRVEAYITDGTLSPGPTEHLGESRTSGADS